MRNSLILDALFPEIRSRILAATMGRAEKTWYLSELADFLHTRPSSLQREIEALTRAGILEQRRDGRRLYFKADTNSPVFEELRTLFEKTAGIVPSLQQELEPFGERIRFAFLYGSVARSEENSGSDIDLMVVGEVGLATLLPALRNAERTLGRPVNATIFSVEEYMRKARGDDHFLNTVLKGQIEFVKGSVDDLDAVARQG